MWLRLIINYTHKSLDILRQAMTDTEESYFCPPLVSLPSPLKVFFFFNVPKNKRTREKEKKHIPNPMYIPTIRVGNKYTDKHR
jgi:hypothetical protein